MRALLCLLVLTIATAADWVEVDKLWFKDEARDRNLGVKVFHPASGNGPWPVIIFSHGLGGSQWGYGYLGQAWAAHGYVSIHCTHPGSDWLLWDGKGMSEGLGNLRKALADPVHLENRPRDIAFLIDQLPLLEAKVPALAGKLDRGRIGVAGHSMGAYTALAIAGLRPDLGERHGVDLGDARPRAFIALSPPGTGAFLPPTCWAAVARPTLVVTGTEDDQPLERHHGLDWHLEAWTGLPPGGKQLLVIDGAQHMTFAGGGMGVKADPAHLAAIELATTAFWDAWLREGPSAGPAPPPARCSWRWDSKP